MWNHTSAILPSRKRKTAISIPDDLFKRAEAFAKNGVDAALVAELSNEDLKDLGVVHLADRKRLLKAIDHALAFTETERPQSIAEWRRELVGDPASAAPVGIPFAARCVATAVFSPLKLKSRPRPRITRGSFTFRGSPSSARRVPGSSAR